jgi:hypothetical protein
MYAISPRRTALNQTEEYAPIRTLPIRLAFGAMKVVSVNSGVDSSSVYKVIVFFKKEFKFKCITNNLKIRILTYK